MGVGFDMVEPGLQISLDPGASSLPTGETGSGFPAPCEVLCPMLRLSTHLGRGALPVQLPERFGAVRALEQASWPSACAFESSVNPSGPLWVGPHPLISCEGQSCEGDLGQVCLVDGEVRGPVSLPLGGETQNIWGRCVLNQTPT